MPKFPKLSGGVPRLPEESKIALALPLKRAIALLVTIALCIFNLQYEPKDTTEGKATKWGLASLHFLVIVLLLFKSHPIPLFLTFAFSALAILPAYYRFKDHENTRLVYIIIQGIIAVGALIKAKKRDALKQAAAKYDQIQASIDANALMRAEYKKERDVLFKKEQNRTELETKRMNDLDEFINKSREGDKKLITEQNAFNDDKKKFAALDIEFKGTDQVEKPKPNDNENSLWDD